jgi:glycosyltransferase involved in cell wall biosynthesis
MKFSIITPSFRSLPWLQLCVASVADQEGVEIEHIVQDSCSDDGTPEWLAREPRVRAFIEKDTGMYDAVNRGFRRATGDILAYLNCDEQYLPGALRAARRYFESHPEVEVVIADTIVTDQGGEYICHRYALVPNRAQIWVRFSALSCALFVRASVVRERGIYFDTSWRMLGDFIWVKEMVERGVRIGLMPIFTSIFTDTGDNLCLTPKGRQEQQAKQNQMPASVRHLYLAYTIQYRLRLALRGSLWEKPFDYSIYTQASPARRINRRAAHPTSYWKQRWRPESEQKN